MGVLLRTGRSLVKSVLGGLAIALVVLSLLSVANQASRQDTTQAANAGRADSYGDLFNALYGSEMRSARGLAAFSGTPHSLTALKAAFRQSAQKTQALQPEVTGAYLFGPTGHLLIGLQVTSGGAFNTVRAVPVSLRAGGGTALGRALAGVLTRHAAAHVLSFSAGTGPLGDLYLFEPVTGPKGASSGAVVVRLDNNAVVGHYVTNDKVLLVAPPFLVGDTTAGLTRQHRVEVLSNAPSGLLHDRSLLGGTMPVASTSLTALTAGQAGTFVYQGRQLVGGAGALPDVPSYHVIVASPTTPFPVTFLQTATSGVGFVLILLLICGVAIQVVYQEGRVKTATASLEEHKSRLLTEDILNVSQALGLAREGDLTVTVPSAGSEVGLISVLINGLLSDYSQMVAGIIRASRTVQDGAVRVDEGVRSIVAGAAQQGQEMADAAGTVETLAGSAAAVQEATHQATELASEASRSVQQGQGAVGRIGEAVDSIKEAAIGTTREFKRLQEDSIRLTALVSSVKSNAENLDMQAANAALEARHLGTETGSAFATNIGRLARQAQETLADAETAVRSVISSIDAVNRRIERISEQVRLGVDEVRSVRSSFEDITDTNQSLVQFIEQVAGSAQEQAESAQRVAASITAVAAAFQQFNDMLVSSGDEMAHMRLIVADLQQSVANLKVDEALLAEPTYGTTPAERAA